MRHLPDTENGAFPVQLNRHAQILANGLRNASKAAPCTQVHARTDTFAIGEHRHILTRMIGRWGRGVTTVISRDDEQVLRAQQRQQLCKLPVEFRCRIGIAVHIVAVAVHHVKIHEIHERKA